MKTPWNVQSPDAQLVNRLSRKLNCLTTTAAILVNRGYCDVDDIDNFLNPSLRHLRPPETMTDIQRAAHRLARAIVDREKILVFGDYDTDGVTATALLKAFFDGCGAETITYIPHRISEGYGLKTRHITSLALKQGIKVIITVDCGSASHDAVSTARQAGIDVIVTDHHNAPAPLPRATALVNPKRADCPSQMDHLAGVGVAFYLIIHLRQHLRQKGFWTRKPEPNLKTLCDLVALGTVADMVPLVAENRVLTHAGLRILRQGKRPGLAALFTLAGITEPGPDSQDIAFRIAPRLNAAGRMGHAKEALALLTTSDEQAAQRLAEKVEGYNQARQRIEQQTVEQIQRMIDATPALLDSLTLVLWHPDWHEGVLGIAAARMVRAYKRPVILIAAKGGMAKGSARSIEGFDLYNALTHCADTLCGYGGHAMAAGLQLEPDRLKSFRRCFEAAAQHQTGGTISPSPLKLDAELDLTQVTVPFLDELGRLQPFGSGNPQPIFMGHDIVVAGTRTIGNGHLKLCLRQREAAGQPPLSAVWFHPKLKKLPEVLERLAFCVGWHHWRGERQAQIEIKAV